LEVRLHPLRLRRARLSQPDRGDDVLGPKPSQKVERREGGDPRGRGCHLPSRCRDVDGDHVQVYEGDGFGRVGLDHDEFVVDTLTLDTGEHGREGVAEPGDEWDGKSARNAGVIPLSNDVPFDRSSSGSSCSPSFVGTKSLVQRTRSSLVGS
jgi:hypothetical protein